MLRPGAGEQEQLERDDYKSRRLMRTRSSLCGVYCVTKKEALLCGVAIYHCSNSESITCVSMHIERMQLHHIFRCLTASDLVQQGLLTLTTLLLASTAKGGGKKKTRTSVSSPSAFRFPCKVSGTVPCLLSARSPCPAHLEGDHRQPRATRVGPKRL